MDKDLYIEFLENRIRTQIRNVNEKYQRAEMDLQNREEEMQDLKLENDRLKKRDEIMLSLIEDIDCKKSCNKCRFYNAVSNKCSICNNIEFRGNILLEIESILSKLEDL